EIEEHGVCVEDIDGLEVFHCATVPLHADGGVFDTQDVELHRLGIDFPTVVEQHAPAQPEHPGGELLVGLPALGDARDDVTLLIDIGQASVHRRRWMGGVQLIMPVRVEASGIDPRSKPQHTAPFRMPLRRFTLEGESTAEGSADQRGTGRGEEGSPAYLRDPRLLVHRYPPGPSQDSLHAGCVCWAWATG